MTRALTLIQTIQTRLESIRVVNGYATEAGQSVLLGPVPQLPGEIFPYCRLHETEGAVDSPQPHRPSAKVRVNFVAEAVTEQADARQIVSTGHQLVGDLKKALFGDTTRDLSGNVIDMQMEAYRITPPDDGSKVVIAQVRGSFTFVDKFNAP